MVKRENQALTPEQLKLFEDNVGLVYSYTNKYNWRVKGMPKEDFQQEMFIAYCEACRTFDPNMGTLFSSYACQAMMFRIIYLSRCARNKHHGEDLSYDKLYTKGSETASLLNILESMGLVPNCNPEAPSEEVRAKQIVELLLENTNLTRNERDIIYAYMKDMSWTDIAKMKGVSKQAVHYAGQTAFKKMRQTYEQLK